MIVFFCAIFFLLSFKNDLSFKAVGTGQTTDHIADLTITNSGEKEITIKLGPWFIPAKVETVIDPETGEKRLLKYQSYITTEPVIVTIPPGQSVTIPIKSGLCTDIYVPPVPKGVSMPPYSEWIPIDTSNPPPVISKGPAWEGNPGIAKNPFTGAELPGTININEHPEIAGPIIYAATQNITIAVDQLYENNLISTPFSSNQEKERETIIQQTTWIYTAALSGQEYTQEEFMAQLTEQLETNNQIKLTDLPLAQQEQFNVGGEKFWSTFTLTGENAKIIGDETSTPPSISSPVTGDPPPPEETDPPPPEDPPSPPPEDPPSPPPEKDPVCSLTPTPLIEPAMDGGLKDEFEKSFLIKRDEFVPLGAEGKDYDQLKWECEPKNNCPEDGGFKIIPLTGKVKFTWEIISGEGNFVQLGCLPVLMAEEGDHVIFQPPYVPLEESTNEKETIILLKVIDDNLTQPVDQTVERRINITTTRKKSNPDYYSISVKSTSYKLPKAPKPVLPEDVKCLPTEEEWKLETNLEIPDEQKPAVPDNDKMVVGQWMRLLSIAQSDPDQKELKCVSKACKSSNYSNTYEDNIEWEWKIITSRNAGYFITGSKKADRSNSVNGRYVIYEAPLKLKPSENYKDIEIQITVQNKDGLQVKDDEKEKTFTIRVYKAGVELERTPDAWLPEKDNSLDLLSELKYHDGDEWQDALEHMCRIHFFDLVDDSKEKGYCTNAPGASANDCYDYRLAEGEEHELFNERKRDDEPEKCENVDEYFLEARTKRPVKEHTMTINSEDYGGYGKLFSLANINVYDPEEQLEEEPLYISIPVEMERRNGKKKKKEYLDNRVTIPRDIDENMIADNGWIASSGSGRQEDPDNNKKDKDSEPTGDGLAEDGYTAYEEYRGFDVVEPESGHKRTDLDKKDLMVWNEGGFSLGLFREQSELSVFEVAEENLKFEAQVYMANFNSPTYNEHKQAGVKIRDGGTSGSKGGVMLSLEKDKNPAPPNWAKEVLVFVKTIRGLKLVEKGFQSYEEKSSKVVAHELGHACNVYHHGEGKNNQSKKHGLRSGNVECIMRYDNLTVTKCQNLEKITIEVEEDGEMKTRSAKFESVGTIFCDDPAGTGYNAGDECFGNCAKGRGNCEAQFRVSGRHADFPRR